MGFCHESLFVYVPFVCMHIVVLYYVCLYYSGKEEQPWLITKG